MRTWQGTGGVDGWPCSQPCAMTATLMLGGEVDDCLWPLVYSLDQMKGEMDCLGLTTLVYRVDFNWPLVSASYGGEGYSVGYKLLPRTTINFLYQLGVLPALTVFHFHMLGTAHFRTRMNIFGGMRLWMRCCVQ